MRRLLQDFHSSKNKMLFFKSAKVNEQAALLRSLSRYYRKKIASSLKDDELLSILYQMDNDEIVDILQLLSDERQERLVKRLSDGVQMLLKYNPSIAAGMMDLDYIIVDYKSTFLDVARQIKKHLKKRSRAPAIFVAKNGKLIGELLMHKLVLYDKNEKTANHITKIPAISYNDNPQDIFNTFKLYSNSRIAVLGKDGSVLGIIHAEDVLGRSEEHHFSKLYSLFGLSSHEDALDPFWSKFRHRVGWLVVNLFTAFIAALTVSLFGNTIARNVILAAYMPIIAGMWGNAATQTLGVMIRGIALNEVSLYNGAKVMLNEMLSGSLNGVVTGIIIAVVAYTFNQNIMLGIIAFLSLVANLAIAGLAGAFVPLLLDRLGKDPASSSAVFITAATDVIGFFIFLGLATLLL